MSREHVGCNQCGAVLDITPATNFVTCGSCHTQLAVRRTGTAVFTEAVSDAPLPPSADPPPATAGVVRDLQRQQEVNRLENELNRLDIEWEREKEGYKVSGRYGHRYLPTKGGSAWQGAAVAVFGVIWVVFAFGVTSGFKWTLSEETFGPPPVIRLLFPLFGVVAVIAGIVWSVNSYRKADEYEQAEQRYSHRKAQLRGQIAELRDATK